MATLLRVGYFGGSFDPPHRAHLAVARAARDRFRLERVLLAPTGKQPLKPAGSSAPFVDRLAMTALLCSGEAALESSSLDAPRLDGLPNYTVDVLRKLRAELPPNAALFAITGADAFESLPQWRDAPQLLTLAEWIVVSRPGHSVAELDALPLSPAERARVHWLGGVHDLTSATELRAELASGDPVRENALSKVVADYIRVHHLYGQ